MEHIDYTVKHTAKINKEKVRDSRPSIWLSVAKWSVALFLFVAVLACVVASKICFISIGRIGSTANDPSAFIMLVVVLMIPEAVAFIRSAWGSLLRSSHPWPSRKAIIWGLVASTCEVVGLCYFTIGLVMRRDVGVDYCILMMNGLFLIPVGWQMLKNRQLQESWKQLGLFALAFLLGIAGIAGLVYEVYKSPNSSLPVTLAVPVSLLLLSFAWCPKIRKLQVEAREKNTIYEDERRDILLGGSDGVLPQAQDRIPAENGSEKNARAKATIITGLTKLLMIPLVAAAFCKPLDVDVLSHDKLNDGFRDFTINHRAFPYFMIQIFASLIAYVFGWLACSMCLQQIAFALPLSLATPVSMMVALIHASCGHDIAPFPCPNAAYDVYLLAVALWLAQMLSTGYYLFQDQGFIMAKESSLFWLPTYNGAFLEQSLLLNRKNHITDGPQDERQEKARNTCVYICTTMYREVEKEMEQLLKSLHDIDNARAVSQRQIESHIFFDGAVKGEVLNNFVLQLISLIPKTLKVKTDSCMKLKTPYGLQLRWRLPGGMFFHIHLKDNLKVKNKKRWSQVMYMSYVLDYKERQMEVDDQNTYILTTDADVKFTHESVEALLDLMMRDPAVGAVCGRTNPMGVGPLVWYQVFDYAIGHWFQKVANHVLGSVLCCPGCFSVYRAQAVRDVLPIYATGVDNSFEFLTKDMGEDRWLCTLMVQSGWRLEYCAAAEDSTYCPETFDEFYKQRRRWIPSTLANLVLLISEWKLIKENNDLISFLFILYQALMVFSTVIGPSTVILVMVGGLTYANIGVDNEVVPLVLLCLVTIGFALVCLYTKQDFQLKVAKCLTVVFALLMAFVAVGVAAQVGTDLYIRSHPFPELVPATVIVPTGSTRNKTTTKAMFYQHSTNVTSTIAPTTETLPLEDRLPAGVSSFYLGGLIAIFILAALLHPPEAYCVMHGVWYLLCLPSGYLLLLIYSVCNLTDRSWGTREEKIKKADDDRPWYQTLWKKIISCCRPEPPQPEVPVPEKPDGRDVMITSSGEELSDSGSPTSEDEAPHGVQEESKDPKSRSSAGGEIGAALSLPPEPAKSALKATPKLRPQVNIEEREDGSATKWRYPGEKKVTFSAKLPRLHSETPVEEWLQGDMLRRYCINFKENGYDNVSFIAGMTDKDLKAIGVDVRGHRRKILHAIEYIPNLEIAQEVPDNVEDWLTKLGLDEYWPEFERNSYTEPRMLEDLKTIDREGLQKDLNIVKPGHLNKLLKALKKIQYPTEAQRRIQRAREEMNKVPMQELKTTNQDDGLEHHFWEGLRKTCLLPETAGFGAVAELKEKLEELRDSAIMILAIANSIWIILLMTLIKEEHLKILGTSVLGLIFLCIYGFLIVLQFITLLWHRVVTACHVIARAPWKRGQKMMSWSFDDAKLLPPEPSPTILEEIRKQRGRRHRRRRSGANRLSVSENDLREPLLHDGTGPAKDYSSRNSHSFTPHLV